jgi:hypothetical protein
MIRGKTEATMIEKYGVKNSAQREEIKEKTRQTCLIKYGTKSPMQNVDVIEKNFNNSFKKKDYILPSGNILQIQGYERFALDELLQMLDETEIKHNGHNVPELWYDDDTGKKHRHIVDFFIPSQNKCIEVKSTWTLKIKKDNVLLKQTAAKLLGFEYEIWVYDAKGVKVELLT